MPQNNIPYYSRDIDLHLKTWKEELHHKPLLLRGARQVGKSSAVRHLAEIFEFFLEVNFERNPDVCYRKLFRKLISYYKRVIKQNILHEYTSYRGTEKNNCIIK